MESSSNADTLSGGEAWLSKFVYGYICTVWVCVYVCIWLCVCFLWVRLSVCVGVFVCTSIVQLCIYISTSMPAPALGCINCVRFTGLAIARVRHALPYVIRTISPHVNICTPIDVIAAVKRAPRQMIYNFLCVCAALSTASDCAGTWEHYA